MPPNRQAETGCSLAKLACKLIKPGRQVDAN